MNKKLLFFVFLFCVSIDVLLAEDKTFTVKVNQEYYNPFANSFAWQFAYSGNLQKDQYINLHFDIYDRQQNTLRESFDKKFLPGKRQGRVYLFISIKPPNSEFDFNSPDSSNTSYLTSFGDVIINNQRIISKKVIGTNINEKILLVKMEPVPPQSFNMPEDYYQDISNPPEKQHKGREKTLIYDIYITPELKIQKKTQQAPETLEPDKALYEKLSKEELANKLKAALKKRQEVGELYKQNKASLEDLNRVQAEINVIERILHP